MALSSLRRGTVSPQRSISGWTRHTRSAVVLVTGLALTGIGVVWAHRRARERQRLHFEVQASQVAETLRTAFQVPLEVAAHLPALMNSVQTVDRQTFDTFVRPAIARHPSIAGLEWIPLVRGPERAAFERDARRWWPNGFEIRDQGPDGRMVRAPERPTYLPLLYLQPLVEAVVGFDVSVERSRRTDQEESLRAGGLRLSQRYQLVEDGPGVWSVVIYAPVYAPGRAVDTEAERVAAFRGFGVELFRVRPLLERALTHSNLTGLSLALLDLSAPPDEQLLYESRPGLARTLPTSPLRWTRRFGYVNRQWALRFAGDREAFPLGSEPLVVGLLGVLVSLGLALALRTARVLETLEKKVEAARRLGQYTLKRRLGAGGMGTVYEAEHAMLRRPTAIKVLNTRSESHLARFEREVQTTAALTHPNTVTIYDYGRTDDGQFYYVMEYLSGVDLERLVRVTGPMPAPRAIHLMRGVCEALAEAHAAGLVHRDVKPANLMVCHERAIPDFVKVLDFGLVKFNRPTDTRLSTTNMVLGTPDYIAPEAVLTPDEVTASADIYSLGCVLYWLLTAKTVFSAAHAMALMMCHVNVAPTPPSAHAAVPAGLEAVILRCLAKKPEGRPASALALLDELDACAAEAGAWSAEESRRWWAEHRASLQVPEEPADPLSHTALGVHHHVPDGDDSIAEP